MTKVYLLLGQAEDNINISQTLVNSGFEIMQAEGLVEDVLLQINNFLPDLIVLDSNIDNCEFIIRQIKSVSQNQNMQIILLLDKNSSCDFIGLADGLIEYPLNQDVLLAVLNSHLKIKKSLDRLYENNKELSKSLYQLNVLYNTSSQFAGTLNTDKLYDIMIEAMEKTLSFDISSVLVFSSSSKPVFNLNTMYMPSENLVNALKIRSLLNYKSMFSNFEIPRIFEYNDIEVFQKTKQMRSNQVFGLESISFDSLFAPIKVGDDFFGVVELFRKIPFTQEDVTCFQAITHQVALPLRSAKLYEEITITNKKLEKLEKLKSEFVSIVSHELRTPLTPINNSLEIVLNEQAGAISPEAKNFISMAKRNIQRLSGIIEDLLDLSRIQTGKLDFKYKLVDITPSLELLQKTFLQVAIQKNIKIDLKINDKLPEIYADIRRIEQIFSNLVTNALKFTQDGGTISVEAGITDAKDIDLNKLVMSKIVPSGKYVKISVKDTGIGIKKDDIPKIFDKFSQIESSLNRNKGGVGLGLTITKQLIDSHLGAIWVESEEKKGSCFNVILPFADEIKVFEMDLMHNLINNPDTGIVKINFDPKLNLIEKLKENNLLNFSCLSREVLFKNNGMNTYIVFIPKISEGSFEAIFATLSEYCQKIKEAENLGEYDIMLKKLYCFNKIYDIGLVTKL